MSLYLLPWPLGTLQRAGDGLAITWRDYMSGCLASHLRTYLTRMTMVRTLELI